MADRGTGPPVGLTETSVRAVVEDFYGRIRADPELGPMFETRLADRWPEHLARMCDFWTTVLLGTRRYRGHPMASHMRVPGLEPAHFTRWMDVFARTARAHLAEDAAVEMIRRAGRMRRALERAVCAPDRDSHSPAGPDSSSGPSADPHPGPHVDTRLPLASHSTGP